MWSMARPHQRPDQHEQNLCISQKTIETPKLESSTSTTRKIKGKLRTEQTEKSTDHHKLKTDEVRRQESMSWQF